jgi:hypothetical protein
MIGEIIQSQRRKPSWLHEAAPFLGFVLLLLIWAVRGRFELLDHVPIPLWWGSIFVGLGWGFFCNRMIYLRRKQGPPFLDKGRLSNIAYGAATLAFTIYLTASYFRLAYEVAAFTTFDAVKGDIPMKVVGTYTVGRSSAGGVEAVSDDKGRRINFPTSSMVKSEVQTALKRPDRSPICINVQTEVGRWHVRRIHPRHIAHSDLQNCNHAKLWSEKSCDDSALNYCSHCP